MNNANVKFVRMELCYSCSKELPSNSAEISVIDGEPHCKECADLIQSTLNLVMDGAPKFNHILMKDPETVAAPEMESNAKNSKEPNKNEDKQTYVEEKLQDLKIEEDSKQNYEKKDQSEEATQKDDQLIENTDNGSSEQKHEENNQNSVQNSQEDTNLSKQASNTEEMTIHPKEGSNSSPRLTFGAYSNRGKRKRNEDAHAAFDSLPGDPSTAFFGVFDGHGGKKASSYCAQKLHKNIVKADTYESNKIQAITDGFIDTDEKFGMKMEEDGCTANVVLITQTNMAYIGNAGDSRCVLGRNGEAIPLSEDHKPSDQKEKERIEECGHDVVKETTVVNGKRIPVFRVDGVLAVSRAIGDSNFKDNYGEPPEKQAVSCVPDVREQQLQSGDILILACDGLWDVMSNQEAVDMIEKNRNKSVEELAALLGDEALARESGDNVTVVVVCIH